MQGLFTVTVGFAEMRSWADGKLHIYLSAEARTASLTPTELQHRDWRGSPLAALDFAENRSRGDAKLLGKAQGRKKGERMSDEEAGALRRKVGGTASELSTPSYVHPSTVVILQLV